MSIDLNGFWQSWGVVSGNTQATNQYEFWKGMVMSNGQVLNNQFVPASPPNFLPTGASFTTTSSATRNVSLSSGGNNGKSLVGVVWN
jgi:hypothetical protein